MHLAYSPLISLSIPVPSKQSTMTSYLSINESEYGSILIFLEFLIARGLFGSLMKVASAERYLAATNPSPPLFPVPQMKSTFFDGNLSEIISASSFPAFSINDSTLIPKCSALPSNALASSMEIMKSKCGYSYKSIKSSLRVFHRS